MPCLFVENLSAIDCSILDPDRGLIGASWSVDVEMHGELDAQSMVFDFSKVKKTIKQIIDQQVDHKLLVPRHFNGCKISTAEEALAIEFLDRQQELILHRSPQSAVCILPTDQIDTVAVTRFLEKACLAELPKNVERLAIKLNEEQANGNYYCYSHGLKKHQGNCQRIAHGHRSQIQIWQGGERSELLEKAWAQRWQDIYLATQTDVVSDHATSKDEKRIQFSYHSEQGEFELTMPKHRVHLMQADTTVECIAEHIRELLELDQPKAKFVVKAFEGIGKGAIA